MHNQSSSIYEKGEMLEPPNVYLRNYEPSKDRCERAFRTNQSNLLGSVKYEQPPQNGNFLRTKNIMKEKHLPLKLAEVGESARLREAIKD